MLFWVLAATLSLLAGLGAVWPLMRGSARRGEAAAVTAFYAAQLEAVSAEAAAGRISEAQRSAAEIELKRRLLASVDPKAAASAPVKTVPISAVQLLALGAVPALGMAAYLAVGSPGLQDAPIRQRADQRQSAGIVDRSERALVLQLEEAMRADPTDPQGWSLLAGAYVRLGRYDKAVAAFRSAIEHGGPTSAHLGGLGEALVLGAEGRVSDEALAVFGAILAADPADPRARYFLGLRAAQEQRLEDAVEIWQALLATAPADSPWAASVADHLARARTALGRTPADAGNEEAMAEILALPPEEQRAAIEGMVASLDARLEASPEDLEGWLRLARAYGVLGRPSDAEGALTRAAAAFEGDEAALRAIAEARALISASVH